VHVQAEDQVGAGDVLQVFDDALVALAVGDLLRLPVAEGVRARGDDAHAPFLRELARLPLSSVISSRACLMSLQMPVPVSTTDWCISGRTRSRKSELLRPSSSSWLTYERSSRVSAWTIWNSSSTPSVN
jgi:hypothetical protein